QENGKGRPFHGSKKLCPESGVCHRDQGGQYAAGEKGCKKSCGFQFFQFDTDHHHIGLRFLLSSSTSARKVSSRLSEGSPFMAAVSRRFSMLPSKRSRPRFKIPTSSAISSISGSRWEDTRTVQPSFSGRERMRER